jgi:copper resistance protein D
LLLTAGCALVVLGCAVVRLRDPGRVAVRVPLVAALLGVLTPAVTGHASTSPDHQVAVLMIALHAGAAALWVGGLGGLLVLVAARRRLLDGALPRYSTVAGMCIFAVAATGVVSAVVRLESWGALVTTGYGALVLVKAVLVVVLGGLGRLARRRLATGRTPVLRWAGIEVALMAVTLGVAAALTQTA